MNEIPTEPGWYWWRFDKNASWEVVRLHQFGDWFVNGFHGKQNHNVPRGIFGPRIEEPEE